MTGTAERRAKRVLAIQRQRQAKVLSDLRLLLQRKSDAEQRALEMGALCASVDALGQRFSDLALRYMVTAERDLVDIAATIDVQREEYQKFVLAVQLAERRLSTAQDTAMRRAEQQQGAELVRLHAIHRAARSR